MRPCGRATAFAAGRIFICGLSAKVQAIAKCEKKEIEVYADCCYWNQLGR